MLAAAFLLPGCAGTSAPDPTAKHLEYAGRNGETTSLSSLKHGRKLYLNRCASCHILHKPAAFPASEWPAIVERMAENSKLNPDQKRDVAAYLAAVAAVAQDTASANRPIGSPAP